MLWLWRTNNKNDGYEKDLRIEIKSERGKVLQFPFLSGLITPQREDSLPFIHHHGLSVTFEN